MSCACQGACTVASTSAMTCACQSGCNNACTSAGAGWLQQRPHQCRGWVAATTPAALLRGSGCNIACTNAGPSARKSACTKAGATCLQYSCSWWSRFTVGHAILLLISASCFVIFLRFSFAVSLQFSLLKCKIKYLYSTILFKAPAPAHKPPCCPVSPSTNCLYSCSMHAHLAGRPACLQ